MLAIQRVAPGGERAVGRKGSLPDCGTAVVRAAFASRVAESVMKARHFHHQPRPGLAATGPIAFADEDDRDLDDRSGAERQPAHACSQALGPLLTYFGVRGARGIGCFLHH
jgi:hypothetical protein